MKNANPPNAEFDFDRGFLIRRGSFFVSVRSRTRWDLGTKTASTLMIGGTAKIVISVTPGWKMKI